MTKDKIKNSETPKKPNAFVNYFKTLAGDFKRAIQDNINIIWALLIGSSGVFIGLFLDDHVVAINSLVGPFKLCGFEMFAMVIAGCLNIVWAFGVMKTRSLTSSIFAAITTLVITVCGVLWITNFYQNYQYTSFNTFAENGVLSSIVCVILAIVFPVIGTLSSFFTINWNYKKDKF